MKKKNTRLPVIFFALAGVSMLLAGCSGGSTPETGPGAGSYALTITQPDNGTITTSPAAGTVTEGATVLVTVTPVYGYKVSVLNVNGSPIEPVSGVYSFPMPGADAAITAVIIADPDSYLITTQAVDAEGVPIEINDIITFTITGKTNVKDRAFEDDEINVTAEELNGFDLDGITVKDSSGADVDFDDDDNIFTMPASDVTITAAYTLKEGFYQIHIDTSNAAEGSISTDPNGAAEKDDPVTITVLPEDGYEVEEVLVLKYADDSDISIAVGLAQGTGENTWEFTMPEYAVKVTAIFKADQSRTYTVNPGTLSNGTISFTGLTDGKASATTTVTVIAHPDEGYEVDGGPTSTPSVTFTSTGVNTWTFPMPPSNIEVSVAFKLIGSTPTPTYTVSPGALVNGTVYFTGVTDGKAAANATVTVTASPSSGYEVDGTPTSTPSVTFTPTEENTWTFPMPPENITVNVAFKAKTYTLSAPSTDANGTFSFDKTGVVSPGTTVTLTVTALNTGYKMSPAVSPSSLTLTKKPGVLQWTFEMPPENVTFTKIFAPLDKLEIYKGGARAGITLSHNETDYTENDPVTGVTDWLTAYDSIVLNSDKPGRDGNLGVLEVPHNSNVTFALVSDTAFNIATDNIVALSFWAKGTGSTAKVFAVGFGDIVNNNREDVLSYHGESRENFDIPTDGTWKHYIVPVPAPRNLEFTRSFYIRADLWGTGNTVYLDDIEFLTSGVTVDEIKIPATYSGKIAYPGPSKVTPLMREAIRGGGDLATTTYIRYKHEDGAIATLYDEWSSRPVRFDRWLMTAFTYTVDGDATIVNEGTFEYAAGILWKEALITTTKRNGTLNLYANLGGTQSTPMQVDIYDSIMLEDFEAYIGGIPANGDNGYWHQSMGMTWFADGGDERHDGARGGLFSPEATGARGGRNFPAPVNLTGCTTISFWMRTKQPADGYTFELVNGGAYNTPNSGTFASVPFSITAGAGVWQQITLNLSAFAGLDLTAVTGYAIGVTTYTTTDEYRVYIDTIEAK
jgi:hypothetical protein